ncbi:glycosyltransferase family 2 protein [Aerococcaceae bacterium zg-ZUI334]|uniref:glycosyltransferase family 2 protein n=1 Tax=Aerococcaceae bacterium zg-252 TaxID=2796928 RepID=UPI001B997E38|nr:glycosyltransferase family 2 protein [Aerococcaceae bacterium zg-ZUI334]
MNNKILSVVIPSYNCAEYLLETIPTFLDIDTSLKERIEIIIVNDGSTDYTATVGEQFEQTNPNVVRLINKENGGHGSTINTGIKVAKGKYFKVVDGDDFVDSPNFEKLIRFLLEIDVDQVVTPYVNFFETTNQRQVDGVLSVKEKQITSIDEFLKETGAIPAMHAIVYKTELLRDKGIQLYEHCFYVDMQYIVFPLQYVETVAYLNAPLYQYRLGNAGQSVSMASYVKNEKMHERVIKSLVEFINHAEMSMVKEEMVNRRIADLCATQTNIYLLNEDSKQGKEKYELLREYLKEHHAYTYNNPFSKKDKLLSKFSWLWYGLAYGYKLKVKK